MSFKLNQKVGKALIKDGIIAKLSSVKIDLFSALLGTLLVTGCAGIVALGVAIATKEETSEKIVDYPAKIVGINPPKHFYVLVQYENGNTEEIYVSKHCNNMSKNLVGRDVVVTYRDTTYKDFIFGEDKRHEEYIVGAYNSFCRG